MMPTAFEIVSPALPRHGEAPGLESHGIHTSPLLSPPSPCGRGVGGGGSLGSSRHRLLQIGADGEFGVRPIRARTRAAPSPCPPPARGGGTCKSPLPRCVI